MRILGSLACGVAKKLREDWIHLHDNTVPVLLRYFLYVQDCEHSYHCLCKTVFVEDWVVFTLSATGIFCGYICTFKLNGGAVDHIDSHTAITYNRYNTHV